MSDHNQPFDPTAPEGDAARGSAYISKKDFRIISVAVLCLIGLLFPIYKVMERNSQKARCALNVKAISTALNEYAALHDDRFPPIMRTAENGSPDLGETGLPYTWVSDIEEHMSPRASFLCPSASPDEIVYVEGTQGKKIPVTYGMYAPYGGYLRSVIENPDQTIIIAETSNFGGGGSFDPTPYLNSKGEKITSDGFVIGWNDSNIEGSDKSQFVTRLAFPETSAGKFDEKGPRRHDAGIYAITAVGAAAPLLKPNAAVIEKKFGLPGGIWAVPALSKKKGPF